MGWLWNGYSSGSGSGNDDLICPFSCREELAYQANLLQIQEESMQSLMREVCLCVCVCVCVCVLPHVSYNYILLGPCQQ